ncbi:LysR substrate-binding domain-containing protein [Hoeflea prorocentri]|uniref:LysR substrate-binding domain-containing protein n=1 Tax=Hoeflea prorocentri TaxID=1922333 RepID=A0A9X3UIT8_9HYPH|nr:LysR substrate-binding domain-containing protein [Hoeflea prorocentri]MCY6381623.1 LysR substrate-binding domain-containing protein [Hoeflea prorocentri]MDA5399423.1 LysR substrate-binding domain-containing protein [Hoeflea prorocentri]
MSPYDLNALEIFRTVANEGSISAAALKLNRVQSNVSTRIKQLEDRLQKTLFLRGNRGLTLTPDGELLLSYAERFRQLSAETTEALEDGEPSGTFRIGAMESTAAARLPPILSRFAALYPDVEIVLKTDTAGGLMERLRNHDVEIAFTAEPVTADWVRAAPVFKEELVLVTPAGFPGPDDAAGINGRTVIAFEEGCAYRRYLEQWLLDNAVVPGSVMAVSSYLAIFASVSAGTGFAVAPQAVLDMVSVGGKMRCYPLPGRMSAITTMLVSRADYRSRKLDCLRQLLPVYGK